MVYKQLHPKMYSAVSVFVLLMGLLGLSSITQAAGKPLALNVGKGELIRLNGDAKTVFISVHKQEMLATPSRGLVQVTQTQTQN